MRQGTFKSPFKNVADCGGKKNHRNSGEGCEVMRVDDCHMSDFENDFNSSYHRLSNFLMFAWVVFLKFAAEVPYAILIPIYFLFPFLFLPLVAKTFRIALTNRNDCWRSVLDNCLFIELPAYK